MQRLKKRGEMILIMGKSEFIISTSKKKKHHFQLFEKKKHFSSLKVYLKVKL